MPEVEGVLYLKSDGKKAWKKYFFVLRASGLYYNPRGKVSKSPRDLTCLVQFEFVELYIGLHWKKKYHSPTDFCFALKHPQIQKKTSKFIRYLCAENRAALDQWIMGIRIAKFGKQLLSNYQNLQKKILTWDTHDIRTSISDQNDALKALAGLKQQGELTDSRMSMLEPGSRHSIVKNSMLVRDCADGGNSDVLCLEIDKVEKLPERRSSLTSAQISEPIRIEKAPIKRVSFSNTHSVINDLHEKVLPVNHRDSITSASTDSSEDSTSSGEGRCSVMSHRSSKLRAKLPVTTGTTKHLSEMVQTSLDGGSIGSMDSSTEEWKPSVTSPVQKDMAERRKSAPLCGDIFLEKSEGHVKTTRSMSQTVPYDQLPMSPSSPVASSQLYFKGLKGIMSPPPQKGTKTHSRGSSISSVDSSDSYQGYITSPTNPVAAVDYFSGDLNQSSLMEENTKQKGHGHLTKQGPPIAQKPVTVKKGKPFSGPLTGSVEMGHKRNTSKSSLESVEEISKEMEYQGHADPVHVLTAVPPKPVGPPPPVPQQSQNRPQLIHYTPVIQLGPKYPHQHPRVDLTQSEMTKGSHSAPATLQPQPVSSASTGSIGCLSPRLSSHRNSIPKPVAPPVVPVTAPEPPVLVPPAPRNPAATVKAHKKRPSGGNIVVNGNQVVLGSQSELCSDIVVTQRSDQVRKSDCLSHSAYNSEDTNYPSLPFMEELSHNMHLSQSPKHKMSTQQSDLRIPPQTLPKPTDQGMNGNTSVCQVDYNSSSYPYNYCSNPVIADMSNKPSSSKQQSKKHTPPPPPKRSENTKLSSLCNSKTSAAENSCVPNEQDHKEPMFENCEGILDISDLPPPPPELLKDFGDEDHENQHLEVQRAGKVKVPPPPPPKRHRETHLSVS